MYQLLSAIYMECYPEYAFRKAVQDKKVDETLFRNSEFKRTYNPSEKEILRNLMQSLSEKYRDEI